MTDIDELVRYENENTRLDFKAVQYMKQKHEALIKDIMAMANANASDDRFIIIGVEHRPDGTRDFHSIDEKEFIDAAVYHQLIRENIEPEIHFDYLPYRFEGHLLGVFRIYDCNNQPYMMRKDFGSGLRKGDAYIRKGSHQTRLTRQDFDRITENTSAKGFTGVIRIGFNAPGVPREINLPSIGDMTLPSDKAAERIRAILAERANAASGKVGSLPLSMIESGAMRSLSPFQSIPYEHRPTRELEKNLSSLKEAYREDDLYMLNEEHAAKFNLALINEGESYVEDASISVAIPKLEGLLVVNKIYHKPEVSNTLFGVVSSPRYRFEKYPQVDVRGQEYVVINSLSDLRHGIPRLAFSEDVRIILDNNLVGKTINLQCTLFGKQLRVPRVETLTINVTARNDTAGQS